MEIEVKQDVPEVVVSLAATLDGPEETVETKADETVADTTVVKDAEAVVEEKIEDAKVAGASAAEINELRGLLRELRNDNISLKARLSAAERVQKGDFGTEGADEKLSDLEVYQEAYSKAAQRDFSEILAVMDVNPKFEDLAEVCTNANFEDMFENVARFRSEKNDTDFNVELMKVKSEVWSLPNPYKYMYGVIKEHHPKFAVKETKETETKETTEKVTAKEVVTKKVVTAPGSVASMGGGDETQGGWTAEKIDNMPESKLHEVPKDIYKKWLAGDLN